jgi:hypothetical protein
MRFKDDGEFYVAVHKMAVLAKLKKLIQHSSGEFLTQKTIRTDVTSQNQEVAARDRHKSEEVFLVPTLQSRGSTKYHVRVQPIPQGEHHNLPLQI